MGQFEILSYNNLKFQCKTAVNMRISFKLIYTVIHFFYFLRMSVLFVVSLVSLVWICIHTILELRYYL